MITEINYVVSYLIFQVNDYFALIDLLVNTKTLLLALHTIHPNTSQSS